MEADILSFLLLIQVLMFLFRAGSGIVKLYAYTHVGVNVSTCIYHNWVNNFGAEVSDHGQDIGNSADYEIRNSDQCI